MTIRYDNNGHYIVGNLTVGDINIDHPFTSTMCLHELFEQQAIKFPNNIAVVCEEQQLTYAELDAKANQLARHLRSMGIGKNKYVGVWLARSLEVYITILAILKCGAAYVPIDVDCPRERLNYIVNDCMLSLLVTKQNLASKYELLVCNYFYIDQELESLAEKLSASLSAQETGVVADDLCYVIYTSGTTGTPKGVEITHRNVCHYVQAASMIYGFQTTDRVYQGFSIAFDASIEEIWLTFAAGATLVPGIAANVHAGAGLNEFLNKHQVTVLSCVPTLLAMLEPAIPTLRLLILGGEVCPNDLIASWHRDTLRIINTYGPTEASVVTTYADCLPNKPITIGKPLPNYHVYILNEALQPVAIDEVGEIFVGGLSVARGYVNRPDLTAKKFINHPNLGLRLYRTGDLARQTAEGDLQFVGRADGQIKLRGFRIELSEIEAVLLQFPGVRTAAVTPQEMIVGATSLVAYLVLRENIDLDEEQLSKFLHNRLPDYMVPNLFETLEILPTLASGKVDRANLPKPQIHQDHIKQNYVAPRNEIESKITQVWEELFKHKPISITTDFFHDLGGHSLLAAKMVSLLRLQPEFQHLSMLDIYENTTIEKLFNKIDSQSTIYGKPPGDNPPGNNTSHVDATFKRNHIFCGIAQFFSCVMQFAILGWEFLLVYLIFTFLLLRYELFSLPLIAGIIGLFFALPFLLCGIAILSKWLILGRVKPGRYRLWGTYYFRWWCVQRIQKLFVHSDYFTGSPLMNLYCRLMGAKIGKNCFIGTSRLSTYDLLTIGDDSSVGFNTLLLGYTVENGWLIIGPIEIGKRCFVGTRSVLSIHSKMEDDSSLEDLSLLPVNSVIPNKQTYHGSPGRPLNEDSRKTPRPKIYAKSSVMKDFSYGILHYLSLTFVVMIYFFAYLPGITVVDYFYEKGHLIETILVGAPIGAIAFLLLFCSCVILMKRCVLGRVVPGNYPIKSGYYLRCWMVEKLLGMHVIDVMADSLFYPIFMRMLGAKLGKHVEMGESPHISPDLLTMENDSFSASSVSIGVPRIFGGYATYAPVVVGNRAFIGNFALLPPNTELGDNSLIGCLTVPPINGDAAKSNSFWLGSPAMFLPKRETFAGFSDKYTFQPTLFLYFQRILIETIRIVLPATFAFISLTALFLSVDYLNANYSLLATFWLFPLFELGIILIMTAITIAFKWLLVGRLKEQIKPLWCVFIWKYDIFVHLYDEFLDTPIIEPLIGTPFVAFILRLLGTKIGKRSFINSGKALAEYDLISIGDDVVLNEECILATHLFEDRIFKMSRITIKDGCNVGCASAVLYDTVMEKHSSLGNLSLLMKGEHLPAYSQWEGIPSQTTIPQYEKKLQTAERVWA
jgi:non-ribosomal peptide synthetase-like protein